MKIGIRVKNAITILVYLSKHEDIISSSQLAIYLSTTKNAVLKITKLLTSYQIIDAYNGIKGGYTLKKPLNEILLYDVIEAIDSSYTPVDYTNDQLSIHAHHLIDQKLKEITLDVFSNDVE